MFDPILMLEDDESHALLVKRVLSKARLQNPVVAMQRGDDALDYLAGREPYQDRARHPLPVLVLLDLHVPGTSGVGVLEWIRSQPGLDDIPVLMFSGSGGSEDINRAFELGVDSYLVKPVAFDALLDAVAGLRLPWALLGLGDRKEGGP